MTNLTGKTLGRYHILDRIGQGGMAEVYKAYQPSLDRYVAIKALHAFLLDREGSLEKFQQEARAVAGLRHSNIVQVFDFDNVDSMCFMVMEFLDGPTLKAVLEEEAQQGVRMPYERVAEIITAVGGALGYAHKWGMIHRDVKPQNIMFTAGGQPMLTDFGIAKILSGGTVTDPTSIAGTPSYMSPEQGRGAQLDRRTDLYSLGIVLYEMLTGRPPFEGDTPYAVVYKHINDPIPPPRQFAPELPEPLARVVLKATAKAPEDRYQTADEFVAAIQQAVVEAGRPAEPDAPVGAITVPDVRAPAATPPAGNARAAITSPPGGHITNPTNRPSNGAVTIRLTTPETIVTMGGAPVEATAVITNPSQEHDSDQYIFEVADLDPTWYELDVRSVLLMRGDSSQITIRFMVPRRGASAGVYMYRLQAKSVEDDAVLGYTTGRIAVSSPTTLQMSVEQAANDPGETAHYTLNLANGPVGGLIVEIEGKDPSNALFFRTTPERVRLAALQEAKVGVEVGMRPDAVGEARAYPFTLQANFSGSDETELPIECTAEFVYVPPVRLHLQVEMGTLHGPLGDYLVVLTNPTSLTLDVSLQGDDPNHALDFYFQGESDQLAIGREKAASVKGIVRLADGAPAEGRTYPYTIRAHARNVEGPGELDEVREGLLVYEPPAPAEPAEEPNPLERVTLEVTPAQAQGEPARFTARLQNNGDTATLTILLARDTANTLDYTFDPPQIYLEPGAGGQSSLAVRRKENAPAGDGQAIPFEVVCGAPGSRPEHALVRPAAYLPAAQSRFEAILTPVEPSGLEGAYDVRLINHGGAAFPVVLRGRDTTGLLTFTFAPARVSVPPDAEKVVRLTVKPNALEPLSEEHTYPFEVICWAPGTNAAHTLAGELRYISF
jgi:serine/threonine protein kinase